MINKVLASVALVAGTTLAQGLGSAIVINQCSYDVSLSNTPSDDGVHTADDRTLSAGGSYSQQWTELLNQNGWSIKLSKGGNDWTSNILQYEYTYHDVPGEPLWFDLSAVNGNPWDGNWEITATGGCTPRQAAYRFATDDAYGMQSCDASSSITVTLCSGESGGAAPSSPAESPAPSSPAWSQAPTTAAPVPSTPATSPAYTNTNTWWGAGKNVEGAAGDVDGKTLPTPTTLVTSSVDAWTGAAVTVTNLHYETVTEIVTATAAHKRHVHHPRHPHH